MFIVKIDGGLGNQLFQYALGKNLASLNNTELKLDISSFKNNPARHYCLNYLNIKENFASSVEIDSFKKTGLKKLIDKLKSYKFQSIIAEKSSCFDSDILKLKNNKYLIGYWQSEKYFKPIENTIRKEFKLKDINENRLNPTLSHIYNTDSASLHVRRTDYLTDKHQKIYEQISLDYYQEAINKIAGIYNKLNFFIFSDDIEWVKDNLKVPFNIPMHFVSGIGFTDPEELFLMSQCKHNIIANSSFSWWGAWLNENPNKIVIAPKKWFADTSKNNSDLIPPTWIKL